MLSRLLDTNGKGTKGNIPVVCSTVPSMRGKVSKVF